MNQLIKWEHHKMTGCNLTVALKRNPEILYSFLVVYSLLEKCYLCLSFNEKTFTVYTTWKWTWTCMLIQASSLENLESHTTSYELRSACWCRLIMFFWEPKCGAWHRNLIMTRSLYVELNNRFCNHVKAHCMITNVRGLLLTRFWANAYRTSASSWFLWQYGY